MLASYIGLILSCVGLILTHGLSKGPAGQDIGCHSERDTEEQKQEISDSQVGKVHVCDRLHR